MAYISLIGVADREETATAKEMTWRMHGQTDRRQSVRLRGFPADGIVTPLAAGDDGYALARWDGGP